MTFAWTHWKYPLTVTLFFFLLYGLFGIFDPNPSVKHSDDIRLLLNDRHRLRLPGDSFTDDEHVIVEHDIEVVAAPEQWYPTDSKRETNEANGRRKFDSDNLESHGIHNTDTLLVPREDSRNGIEGAGESDNFRRKVVSKDLQKWMQDREIVGNEQFVNRFQNGIQKPEDFFERSKDTAVKIGDSQHPASHRPTTGRMQTTGEHVQNAQKSNRTVTFPHKLLSVTTKPPVLVSEKYPKLLVNTETKNVSSFQNSDRIKSAGRSDPILETVDKTDSSTTVLQSTASQRVGRRHKNLSKPGSVSKVRTSSSVNGTTLADLKSTPYPPLVVNATGVFLDRVRAFNAAIADVSSEILKRRGYGPWRNVADPSDLVVIWGNTDDFLERVSDHSAVKTILLPWIDTRSGWSSLSGRQSNVLVKEYYEWSSTPPLCAWIQTPGFTKARWDAVYDRECNEEMSRAAQPQSLEFMYFRAKPINVNHYWPNYGTAYPTYFYTRPPPHVFYIHLLQDAVVNTVGDVVAGRLKLVPYTCSHDNLPTVPVEYPERPVYRELFVMTQFWGTSFFHKIVEVMPRVAPYVDFLRANPGVQIHAPEDRSQVSEILTMLGIDPVRVVTGVTRAKLAYLPQGTPCGFPDGRSIQLLSKLLRDHVRATQERSAGRPPRNRLIYVRRSGLRRLAVESQVEFVLRAVAESRQLNYTVFSDRPTPPLKTAAELFNAAVAVFGPHGAGLANVVFSQPGTAVIEGVCNEPHVNMCYQMTAHMLGLRYHAVPSRGGCERVVDIAASDVESAVETYVDMVLADIRGTGA